MKEKEYVLGIEIRHERLTRFVDKLINVSCGIAAGIAVFTYKETFMVIKNFNDLPLKCLINAQAKPRTRRRRDRRLERLVEHR